MEKCEDPRIEIPVGEEKTHLCQLWEQFVADGFEWRTSRNMMEVIKDAQADVSNYWGYLKPLRRGIASWEDRIEMHDGKKLKIIIEYDYTYIYPSA